MTQRKEKSLSLTSFSRIGKLIAALMSSDVELISAVEQRLSERFGEIDVNGALYPFDFSDYYTEEMGGNLQKKFVSFAEMIPVDTLPEIKHYTNALEQQYAVNGNRRINLDPGYVTHAQMVLATTKAFSHRIYLGAGIYAELTYLCKGKQFFPLAWTYPDYREQHVIAFFHKVRAQYLHYTRNNRIESEDATKTRRPEVSL